MANEFHRRPAVLNSRRKDMTKCLLQVSWTPPPPPSNTLGKGKLLGKASLYIFVWCLAVSISGTPLSAAQHSNTVFWTGACGQWMPLANIHNLPTQKISSIRYQRSSKHIIEHHMAESWLNHGRNAAYRQHSSIHGIPKSACKTWSKQNCSRASTWMGQLELWKKQQRWDLKKNINIW